MIKRKILKIPSKHFLCQFLPNLNICHLEIICTDLISWKVIRKRIHIGQSIHNSAINIFQNVNILRYTQHLIGMAKKLLLKVTKFHNVNMEQNRGRNYL